MNIEFLNLSKSPWEGYKVERRKIEEMNQFRFLHTYMKKS
jgi:hypothetical protein